jgi:hypothetical protein
MLSLRPEERGTAKELAETLEQGAAREAPGLDDPLFDWETQKSTEWLQEDLLVAEELGHRARRRKFEKVHAAAEADAAKRAEAERQKKMETRTRIPERLLRGAPRTRSPRRLLWLAATVVGALVLWPWDKGLQRTGEDSMVTRGARGTEQRTGGSSHVGDTAVMSANSNPMATPAREIVAVEVLPKPLPGQLKPDAKGQCRKGQHAINGGCWMKVELGDLEDCKGMGNSFEYKGGCYAPIFPPAREPAAAPMKPAER